MLKEFTDFIRKQGVVGMAVGLAIGLQATDTVSKLVDGLINPLVNWLLSFIVSNPAALETNSWTISTGEHPLTIGWGQILSGLIKLAAVSLVIFYVIKKLRLEKLDKAKG